VPPLNSDSLPKNTDSIIIDAPGGVDDDAELGQVTTASDEDNNQPPPIDEPEPADHHHDQADSDGDECGGRGGVKMEVAVEVEEEDEPEPTPPTDNLQPVDDGEPKQKLGPVAQLVMDIEEKEGQAEKKEGAGPSTSTTAIRPLPSSMPNPLNWAPVGYRR
jgi:hypothetical protein